MTQLRRCIADDTGALYVIINAAAERYRGEIPEDCWHEPYMTHEYLQSEMVDGVIFYGVEEAGMLQGAMGTQDRGDVQLIRHAYVLPSTRQGHRGPADTAFAITRRNAHVSRNLAGG